MKILDLGCGKNKVPNSIGLDHVQLPGVDIEHDLLNFPYPFEDESINKIYLRHVIEHFDFKEINSIINTSNEPIFGIKDTIMKDTTKVGSLYVS